MRRIAALTLTLALLAACAKKTENQSEPIRLGYIGPLTGDAVSFGTDTVNGARMAVEEINAAGGIAGRQISLIAEDGRCNGADAAAAAHKLVEIDTVVAIIGGQCSSETLGAVPIAEASKTILVSPISSSPDVTHAGEYIFRVYPSDALKGAAIASYFEKSAFTKIAMISENTDFCMGIHDSVKSALKKGASLVFDETVEPGTKDYRSLLSRLRDMEFDVFLANGQSDSTVAAMVQQMRELGMKQPIVGTDTADSVTLGQIAKEAVEGLRALSVPSLSKNDPHGGPFAQKFEEKYGVPQVGFFFGALSYEATRLVLDTIRTVGTDGPAIRDALSNHSGYNSIVGTMTFDGFGDIQGIPFALKEFQNGVLVEVERIPL